MSSESAPKRGYVYVLIGALVLFAGLLIANAASDGSIGLGLSHRIQTRLGGETIAANIDVPGVGPSKMFLHRHDTVITPAILTEGLWEPNETFWFTRMVREGDVVVDVGANVGWFTVLAAQLVGESGHVYAFEPVPENFAILEKNVRVNGFRNVTLVKKAVSNENGTLEFFIQENNPGGHSVWQKSTAKSAIDVEAVSLDSYFAGRLDQIDFVKLDTQGAEGAILNGMTGVIDANDDLVMSIEYWPYGLAGFGYDSDDVLKLLSESRFRFFNLGPGPGKVFRKLPELTVPDLQYRYPKNKGRFTNLLVVRDAARLQARGVEK
jgi:FkbM family methyltransferase